MDYINRRNEKVPIPRIDESLINYLKTIYPDQYPDIKITDREIWSGYRCCQPD